MISFHFLLALSMAFASDDCRFKRLRGDEVWKSELRALGYPTSRAKLLPQTRLAYGAEYLLRDRPAQKSALEKDMRQLIADKAAQFPKDKRLVLFEIGLGSQSEETRDLIQMALEALKDTHHADWKIEVLAVDLLPKTVKDGAEFLKEDFPAAKYPQVSVHFAVGDITNRSSLEKALKQLGDPPPKADYICQRNISRPNFSLYQEHVNQTPYTTPLSAAGKAGPNGEQMNRAHHLLSTYLPYRYLFELAGRDSKEAAGLGTRMIVEDITIHAQAETIPMSSISDFVPPGTRRIGSRGVGIVQLEDLETVMQTGLSSFQQALRNSRTP